MSKTPDEISAQIVATLSTTLPGLSCAVGTPERKIIDAVGETISEAYIDQYLVGSLMDIDTKVGLELEQFVGIFGFGRYNGKPAKGVVRVNVVTSNTADTTFQLGTQFYTQPGLAGVSQTLYFASTQAVVLTAGNLSADIPVQCTTVGTQGNVPPDSITYLGQVVGGSTVTNLTAMTGGVDTETDQELRQRFKDTLLRSVTGTSDFYEALCQQNTAVNRVVVYGPLSLYTTQIPAPSGTLNLGPLLNQDVKYAWPDMVSVFSDLGTETEAFFSPVYDYAFNSGASPQFVRNTLGELVTGQIVDLEFQYTTQSSRNDPENGITNKVDIFVDGVQPFAVTEKAVVTSTPLTNTTTDVLYKNNFHRVGSAGTPVNGNNFMRLGSVPIVSFPSTITVGTDVYEEGTDYWRVQSTTLLAGSHLEMSGIEWSSASGAAGGTELTLNYVYNQVPELLNALLAHHKQITSDVMVHQAEFVYIKPCFSVEYDRSYSVTTVNTAIINRLQQFFAQMPFGAQIKISALMMFVQQTPGVVGVKLTTSGEDADNNGVQLFDNSAEADPYDTKTDDFKLDDDQLAIYQGVKLRRVATP